MSEEAELMDQSYRELAYELTEGRLLTREEGIALLETSEDDFLLLMDAAHVVRRHYFGNVVRVHVLENAKSGVCPEDCKFCSQSLKYNEESEVPKYKMKDADQLVAAARRAVSMGAVTYCMVTSTRGPSLNEVYQVTEAARRIKEEFPGLKLCASLGLLKEGQAEALADSGIDRYNHNLEAAPGFFPKVATSHKIDDRIETVRKAKRAGLEACCGGIVGLGESREDWIDLVLTLRELRVDAVPLNFLDPRPGTPMGEVARRTPRECLTALAIFRLMYPSAELRVAGGREVVLRSLGPLSLWAANSIFTNGYLTTPGAEPSSDHQMILDAGFVPEVLTVPLDYHESLYEEEDHDHDHGHDHDHDHDHDHGDGMCPRRAARESAGVSLV